MCQLDKIRERGNNIFKEIKTELYYFTLLNNLPLGVCVSNNNNTILDANNTFLSMLGYNINKICNLTWIDITHKDDIELSLKYSDQQTALKYHTTYTIPKRYITKSGNIIYSLTTISNVNFNLINKIATILNLSNEQENWWLLHANFVRHIN